MSGPTYSAAFGYHTERTAYQLASLAPYYITINGTKFLSYIPVAGILPGLYSIIAGISEFTHAKAFNAIMIGRGFTGLAGFGALFLIPDLIVTINRQSNAPVWEHERSRQIKGLDVNSLSCHIN